jgi:uncharacterized repeat protein (TIGR03803 family)
MVQQQIAASIFDINLRARKATLVALAVLLVVLTVVSTAPAQTFTVLHSFTNGNDGSVPLATLTLDAAGNLFGTASQGGVGTCDQFGCGTVFELKRSHSGFIFYPIYLYQGRTDGFEPEAPLTIAQDGSFYSSVAVGGSSGPGCGVIVRLQPPAHACASFSCPWHKTDVYTFQGPDGCDPSGPVVFDQAGNLYGTTLNEDGQGYGNVWQLIPGQGGWTETVLHNFALQNGDGIFPFYGGVTFDSAGNIYGTASGGGDLNCEPGYGCGMVFKLTRSGSEWIESDVYNFENGSDGGYPAVGVIFDAAGNLYGGTSSGGSGDGGTVFELSPSGGGGYWNFTLLYSIVSQGGDPGVFSNLTMDQAGNMYGTSRAGGVYQEGSVFKLTPSAGGWTYSTVHDFNCATDGCGPWGGVTVDSAGNLYGTTGGGGAHSWGTVWEITP